MADKLSTKEASNFKGLLLIPPRAHYLMLLMSGICFLLFSVNPYLIIYLDDISGLTTKAISRCFLFSIIFGNAIAYFISRKITNNTSHFFVVVSIVTMLTAISLIHCTNLKGIYLSIIIVCLALLLYRFSLGIYFSSTRIMNFHICNNVPSHHIASLITTYSNLGACFGPLVGAYVVNTFKFEGLLYLFQTGAIIIIGLFLIQFKVKVNLKDKEHKNDKIAGTVKPFKRYIMFYISFFLMFLFQAQVFTYIPLIFDKNPEISTEYIGYFFSMNAAILLILSYIVNAWMIKIIKSSVIIYCIGLIFTVTSLVIVPIITNIAQLFVCAFLFTMGEIISPTIAMVIIKDNLSEGDDLGFHLANYTMATSAFGLGIGQYLGMILSFNDKASFALISWIVLGMAAYVTLSWGFRLHNSQVG